MRCLSERDRKAAETDQAMGQVQPTWNHTKHPNYWLRDWVYFLDPNKGKNVGLKNVTAEKNQNIWVSETFWLVSP